MHIRIESLARRTNITSASFNFRPTRHRDFLFFLSAALRTGVDEAKLVILPPLNGDSGTKMVVKSGSKFTVSCIYDHPELSSDKIHWRNEHGKEIDGESSAR